MRLILASGLLAFIGMSIMLADALGDAMTVIREQDRALVLYRKAATDGVELAESVTAAYDRCRGLRVVSAP